MEIDLIERDFPIQKRIVKIGQSFRRIDGAADNFSANQPEFPDLTRLRHLRRDGDRERGNVLRLPIRAIDPFLNSTGIGGTTGRLRTGTIYIQPDTNKGDPDKKEIFSPAVTGAGTTLHASIGFYEKQTR